MCAPSQAAGSQPLGVCRQPDVCHTPLLAHITKSPSLVRDGSGPAVPPYLAPHAHALELTRRVHRRTRIAITGDGPGSVRGSGVIFGGSAPPRHSNQGLSGTRPSAYSFPHSLLSLFSHACARTSTRYLAWVHATFLRNGPDTEV